MQDRVLLDSLIACIYSTSSIREISTCITIMHTIIHGKRKESSEKITFDRGDRHVVVIRGIIRMVNFKRNLPLELFIMENRHNIRLAELTRLIELTTPCRFYA